MHEEREFEGYWWLPADPDRKIPGTLTVSQRAIRLELLGAFDDEMNPFAGVDDQPRIFGMSRDRRRVTLEDCVGLGRKVNLPGFPESAYGPTLVLDGAWYEPDEEVRFDEISVKLSELDTWAVTSGFTYQLHTDAAGESLTSLNVSYKQPPPISVELDDGSSLTIEFGFKWSGHGVVTTESHITQSATFRVRFKDGASLERALEFVAYLRNFLSLGVGRPLRVLSVRGFHDAAPRRIDVKVLYRLVGVAEHGRAVLPHEMFFTLADAHPRIREIFQSWFDRQETLGPVFARYFHIVHGGSMALEHEFESYVRVLETYHRRTHVRTDAESAVHEARLEAILSAVPGEHREWLAGELEYSYEPSLSQRLKATLARCPGVTTRLIGGRDDRKRFVWRARKTRNYEVHLDPSQEGEAAEGRDLLVLVTQLRALVEMTLVLEVGFTCEDAEGFLERPRRYELVDQLRSTN